MIAENNITEISYLKPVLDAKLSIKDLGNLKYFLARSSRGISVCQRKSSMDLLKETGPLGAKPAPTPMDPSHKLNSKSDTSLISNPTSFLVLFTCHRHELIKRNSN